MRGDIKHPELIVLSLGAGVQSSTLALMAAQGEVTPMPNCAVFADTGWELTKTYEWLDWLEKQLPFPVVRARRPGLDLGERAKAVARGEVPAHTTPPWFLSPGDGVLPRQCSSHYKVEVVERHIRKLLGIGPNGPYPRTVAAEVWLGISQDEMQRMKDAKQKYIVNRWPLIEKRMKRYDCLNWMARRNFPDPPRSACIFCPYRKAEEWREMRDNMPDDWLRACKFDEDIRAGSPKIDGEAFVHRQRLPLSQVDLSSAAEHGQSEFGFLQECEGICGI
jgi:hypothetical protein